jgi:signal transduction histidine kinase
MTVEQSNPPTNFHLLERQYMAWENVLSLIRTLGASLDVDHVTKMSLVTVTQHIAVDKAAFYLAKPGEDALALVQCLGVAKPRIQQKYLQVTPKLDTVLRESDGVIRLRASYGLSPDLLATFHYACYLSDGTDFVGLLLLGPPTDGRPFNEQDRRLLHTMGVVVGMTVKKAVLHERTTQAMERMEAAEQLRKAILDHVSHEFNTPLLVVQQCSELLRAAADDEEQGGELWDMHSDAVKRLRRLVEAVTLVADTDRVDTHDMEWVAAEDFRATVLVPTVEKARSRAVDIVLRSDLSAVAQLVSAPQVIASALDRLIENAMYFQRGADPGVTICAYAAPKGWWLAQPHLERLELHEAAEDGPAEPGTDLELLMPDGAPIPEIDDASELCFVIEVIDHGLGIPDAETESIFDPFKQASNSPNLGVRGAGMGLTAARKLIRDLDGEIVVQSAVGKGSLFAILLPARVVVE